MKKIGFLGGTFDPIHKGHLEAAKIAADKIGLDKVYLMPAGTPPHKEGEYRGSAVHRLNMTKLAANYDSRFEACDYEILKEGKSFSYLTMEHFKKVYSDTDIYFIIGDEAYKNLHLWRHPERLRAVVKFAVCTRENVRTDDNAVKINFPPIDISSTMIREKIKNGESFGEYLTKEVYEYIVENNLYKG